MVSVWFQSRLWVFLCGHEFREDIRELCFYICFKLPITETICHKWMLLCMWWISLGKGHQREFHRTSACFHTRWGLIVTGMFPLCFPCLWTNKLKTTQVHNGSSLRTNGEAGWTTVGTSLWRSWRGRIEACEGCVALPISMFPWSP